MFDVELLSLERKGGSWEKSDGTSADLSHFRSNIHFLSHLSGGQMFKGWEVRGGVSVCVLVCVLVCAGVCMLACVVVCMCVWGVVCGV